METSSHINNIMDPKESNEFLKKYHSINNKLKKRFMRNPNIAEASEQLISLANQCERQESWQYAGLCCLSVSRCYRMLINTALEIYYLDKAGKYFLRANDENQKCGCPEIGSENLQAASSCFSDVAVLSKKESVYKVKAAGSLVKLALEMGPTPASGQLLNKTIDILPIIQAIDTIVQYYIKQDNYTAALISTSELADLIQVNHTILPDYYRLYLRKTEINKLLLALILRRTPQQRWAFWEILDKYTLNEDCCNSGTELNDDEFLLLQSLVLACQSHDNEALLELEGQLWQYMDANQKNLIRTLVRIVIKELCL